MHVTVFGGTTHTSAPIASRMPAMGGYPPLTHQTWELWDWGQSGFVMGPRTVSLQGWIGLRLGSPVSGSEALRGRRELLIWGWPLGKQLPLILALPYCPIPKWLPVLSVIQSALQINRKSPVLDIVIFVSICHDGVAGPRAYLKEQEWAAYAMGTGLCPLLPFQK